MTHDCLTVEGDVNYCILVFNRINLQLIYLQLVPGLYAGSLSNCSYSLLSHIFLLLLLGIPNYLVKKLSLKYRGIYPATKM
jgi:hypothetical protein